MLRILRGQLKRMFGIEPFIRVEKEIEQEFHGNSYCGWSIPSQYLNSSSVIFDIGLGEDISFSESIINKYNCVVHGLDPTPRSIEYVSKLSLRQLMLHRFGLGATPGEFDFYLPNDQRHVSGSILKTEHTGNNKLAVKLVTVEDLFEISKSDWIDVLKLDIEGAEFEVLLGDSFEKCASRIGVICLEFHHRWVKHGKLSTEKVVAKLKDLGFECVWTNIETNEEFTFVSRRNIQTRSRN